MIAGIIPDSTREAVRKGEIAKRSGVQGLMVTPVHYFRPTAEGLYGFFQDIGKKVGLPIIIYNVVPINPVFSDTQVDFIIHNSGAKSVFSSLKLFSSNQLCCNKLFSTILSINVNAL